MRIRVCTSVGIVCVRAYSSLLSTKMNDDGAKEPCALLQTHTHNFAFCPYHTHTHIFLARISPRFNHRSPVPPTSDVYYVLCVNGDVLPLFITIRSPYLGVDLVENKFTGTVFEFAVTIFRVC